MVSSSKHLAFSPEPLMIWAFSRRIGSQLLQLACATGKVSAVSTVKKSTTATLRNLANWYQYSLLKLEKVGDWDWKPDKDKQDASTPPASEASPPLVVQIPGPCWMEGVKRPQHERFLANLSWFLISLWHWSKKPGVATFEVFVSHASDRKVHDRAPMTSQDRRSFNVVVISHFASRAWIKQALGQLYSLLSYINNELFQNDMVSISSFWGCQFWLTTPQMASQSEFSIFLELPMSSQSYCAVAQTLWKWIGNSSLEHKSTWLFKRGVLSRCEHIALQWPVELLERHKASQIQVVQVLQS